MTAITGLNAWSECQRVPADAHGNNVAFSCLNCGGPVLATLMPHQRGSSADKPTECRVCSAAFWVEPQLPKNRLLIHRANTPNLGRYIAGLAPAHTAGQNAASWGVIQLCSMHMAARITTNWLLRSVNMTIPGAESASSTTAFAMVGCSMPSPSSDTFGKRGPTAALGRVLPANNT